MSKQTIESVVADNFGALCDTASKMGFEVSFYESDKVWVVQLTRGKDLRSFHGKYLQEAVRSAHCYLRGI